MEFVACHLNEEGAIGMLRADQSSLYWTAIGVQSYWHDPNVYFSNRPDSGESLNVKPKLIRGFSVEPVVNWLTKGLKDKRRCAIDVLLVLLKITPANVSVSNKVVHPMSVNLFPV